MRQVDTDRRDTRFVKNLVKQDRDCQVMEESPSGGQVWGLWSVFYNLSNFPNLFLFFEPMFLVFDLNISKVTLSSVALLIGCCMSGRRVSNLNRPEVDGKKNEKKRKRKGPK